MYSWIWICSKEFEFLDWVDFGVVAFLKESCLGEIIDLVRYEWLGEIWKALSLAKSDLSTATALPCRGSWGKCVWNEETLEVWVSEWCVRRTRDCAGMYVGMHACMHACMYVCMYVCMHVRMYVCMYVCMYGWMDACMYVCMYVCVCVLLCVCKCVCMIHCTHCDWFIAHTVTDSFQWITKKTL